MVTKNRELNDLRIGFLVAHVHRQNIHIILGKELVRIVIIIVTTL